MSWAMAKEIDRGLATFEQRLETEARALPIIKEYILSLDATMDLEDADIETQRRDDIDLFWTRAHKGKTTTISIEVKGDTTIQNSGNFAFETISNEIGFTQGCFMRSKADYFYYFSIETNELWIFPLAPVREWFIREVGSRTNRFVSFRTHTIRPNGSVYVTRGYLVPVRDVERAFGSELRYRQIQRPVPTDAEIETIIGSAFSYTILEKSE